MGTIRVSFFRTVVHYDTDISCIFPSFCRDVGFIHEEIDVGAVYYAGYSLGEPPQFFDLVFCIEFLVLWAPHYLTVLHKLYRFLV